MAQLNGVEIPEKRKRGRPKGSPGGRPKGGNETVIKDPLISPYKIYIDENQFQVVLDDGKAPEERGPIEIEKSEGYFTKLSFALEKVVKLKLKNNKTYSLREYINSYNSMLKEFHEKMKV